MGRLAEGLDALTIRAISPDRRIHGILHFRDKIELSYGGDNSYFEYDSEYRLASQLGAVIQALLAGQREGHRALVSKMTNLNVVDGPHWDAQKRRFREERDSAPLEGKSSEGWITIDSTGLRDAHVTVANGALNELDAAEFLDEAESAIRDLWLDWSLAKKYLREKYYTS